MQAASKPMVLPATPRHAHANNVLIQDDTITRKKNARGQPSVINVLIFAF
jgi:hypothetical protein